MSLAEIAAVVVLAFLFTWLGWILLATWQQVDDEAREAAEARRR